MPICGGNVIMMVHIPICAFREYGEGEVSASDVAYRAGFRE